MEENDTLEILDIRGQMDELNVRMGFDMTKVKDGINWAYQTSEIDPAAILFLMVIIFIIVGSGYLIIYNVFLISVSSDIKFYGLLKTIGTTGKQLKKIVRIQAMLLYVIGLPLGLLLGYVTGIWLMPVILGMTDVEHVVRSMNPWIFVIAAVFTFITVMISTNKPAKLVAKISPIESMKHVTIDNKLRKNKRTRKVTAFTMAMANVGRSKVKTILVLTSLLLSALTFNVTYTYVNGFDMDSYLDNFLVSNFLVSDSSILNTMSGEHVLDGVNQEFLQQLEQEDSVDDIGKVYILNLVHLLSNEAKERVKQAVAKNYTEEPTYIEMDMQFLEENKIKSYVYGVSDNLMDKIVTESNDIAATKYLTEEQMEKFKTGNYVLTNGYYGVAFPEDIYYQVGEMVTIDFGNGNTKEYEVLSAGTLPYVLDKRYSTKVDVSFILPESEYCSQLAEVTPLNATIYSNNIDETTKFLDNYIATSNLDYESKATYEEEFEAMKNTFMITGFVLSAILGLIGIVNFMNLMITSVSARKLELAMLQSLGLGGMQLKKMLIYESAFYSVSILLFLTTIGAGITYFIVEKMNATIVDTNYRFEIVPVVIIAVVFGSISVIMPLVIYRQFKKLSIIQRLREIG
ncbi:MAG: FtsX-like permease family protein [Eubacteriales bacterium]